MARGCNCAGASCGCIITAGAGTKVTGIGTSADPFVVSIDARDLQLSGLLGTASTATVELSKSGSGGDGDPIVLAADFVLRSPNNTRWTLSVSDAGAISAVAAAPARGGVGDPGIAVVDSMDDVYWDGTTWGASSALHHRYWSLGFNAVPTPPSFKKGDTWVKEST